MDILCPKCGEPWEIDSIHDRVAELRDDDGDELIGFRSVYHDFVRRGCRALGSPCGDGKASPGIALCYELNGDDVDGAAASFEDLAGLIDEMGMEGD